MFKIKQVVISSCSLFFFLLTNCSSATYTVNGTQDLKQQLAVPFHPQTKYHCGPAALASVLNFHQIKITPEQVADQVFIPDKKGSLQLEIKAAVRRADFLPYELSGKEHSGFDNLIKEIDAGHPVLVLQNLSFNWLPQWHYAVVVGYDLQKQQMILHSGKRSYYHVAISTFIKTWERSNYWALVILPPDKMPHSAEKKSWLREATVLESVGRQDAAIKAYQQSLLIWPDNEIALIGMGNFYYSQGRYQQSVEAFLTLTKSQKENAAAWNNLAYALQKQGCFDLSLQAIEKAIEFADDKKIFQESQQELQQTHVSSKANHYCSSINFE